MKNSDILRRAKGRLVESGFVCIAINEYRLCNEEERRLRYWVMALLEGHNTLSGWLTDQGGVPEDEVTEERMLALRFRWLDWMIEYWEARGQ